MNAYLRLWRDLLTLCWRTDRRATGLLFVMYAVQTVAVAALGLTMRWLIDAIQADATTAVVVGAVAAALAFAAHWGTGDLIMMMTVHLVERVSLAKVEPEIMATCVDVPGIEHLERSDFLDRVTALRGQGGAIVDSAWAALQVVTSVLGLGVTLAILGSVNPWLLLLLACAAVQLWLDRRGRRPIAAAELASAPDLRLHQHLYRDVCVNPSAAKEIATSGVASELLARQEEAWRRCFAVRVRADLSAAMWASAGWLVFAAGYTGAIALVIASGSPGEIVLAATVGAQFRGVVEAALRRSTEARSYRRVLQPYLWLRAYGAEHAAAAGGQAPPPRLRHGIELADVTFTYPGTARPAVAGLSVVLPAGSVIGVVGEYGSGKTTLIKLLAKLYRPAGGTIRVDGVDLDRLDTAGWRGRTSAAFQDFGRYQATFADGVTMGDADGDLPGAVAAADAAALVASLPEGTGTLLGRRFGGVELSEGQWQKVALARACLPAEPLLFILDEPTASLDAPSEHAIFTGYIRRSRALAAATGAITVIVSHRFSTVADADLILVMAHGRLAEIGTHRELLAAGGGYAASYGVQASAHAVSKR